VNFIVLLQARTNSSRLPGKVLMKIKNIPIVVLAHNRASNKGASVKVLTSDNAHDNQLALMLESHNIQFFRGDLDNPLKRFADSLANENDAMIVVRLTADNVFPDGELIHDVVEDFCNRKVNYLLCNGPKSGFPHGVSIEVTRVKYIREAHLHSIKLHDKEHVTPFISRKYGVHYYQSLIDIIKKTESCTIDTLEEYQKISKIFESVQNPNHASVSELLSLL
jgi:spore coat polysaccharide biosynthesis protein SpsF (cytidylyltransferase family)